MNGIACPADRNYLYPSLLPLRSNAASFEPTSLHQTLGHSDWQRASASTLNSKETTVSNENPYSAPEAEQQPAELLGNKFGGPVTRGFAKLIDIVLFGFLLNIGFGLFVIQIAPQAYNHSGVHIDYVEGQVINFSGTQILLALISLLLAAATCEWKLGFTPGKYLFGLRVVRADEVVAPSVGSALVRNFAMLFDGLFLGMPVLFVMNTNPYEQRLGDISARTFVIKSRQMPEPLQPTARDFGICLGIIGINFMLFGFVLSVI